MEASSFFSGLLSGVDYRSLIDAIINAQRQPVRRLDDRIAKIEQRSEAFVSYEGLLSSLKDSANALRDSDAFGARSVSSSSQLISASASANSSIGSHAIEVFQVATAEKLTADAFASRNTALGFSGEFFVNGQRVAVTANDSLDDIAAAINDVNVGPDASKVTASVVSVGGNDHRLILSSEEAGSAGIGLADASGGILRSLGVLDNNTSIKTTTSDGALSDRFANGSQAIGTLLSLNTPPAAAAVDIGGVSVTLDLANMSLDDIANEINTQAGLAGSGVQATVVSDPEAGASIRRLDISGTTSFTDNGGILEVLGVVEGGRAGVAHEVTSSVAFQDASGTAPATAATLLSQLNINGSNAGVQVGDTLTVSGTRGDGSLVSFGLSIQAGDTLQDVVDQLNSASDGFQLGSRTATASISANGELVLTDDQTGDSRVSLSIVSNNEGGGTLDFGTIDTTTTGRERQITAGQDAQLQVDGVYLERTTNSIADAIQGVTIDINGASVGEVVTLTISKDIDTFVDEISAFMDAYNSAADFVRTQLSRNEDGEGGPLAGDSTLRNMAFQMRSAMQSVLTPGIAGNFSRLGDLGIEIQQDGSFEVDKTKLREALETDSQAVQRLFGDYGTGSVSEIEFVGLSDATEVGTYGVNITQAATRALIASVGFGGTYTDDGTADSLQIRDVSTDSVYSVALANGDTLQDIIDKINSEMSTALAETHQSSDQLFSDGVGTVVTDSTLLQDLFDGSATNMGVAAGDTISFTGTQAGGAAIGAQFTVTDPAAQTVGDLVSSIQAAVGTRTRVYIDGNGRLQAEDQETGLSLFDLTITSDNAGGGTFSMGTVDVVQEGRGTSGIEAVDNGGQLELSHDLYGSSDGFEISFVAGGADGSASLGLAAGTYNGLDVVGTIGGLAATGTGQLLSGDAGSAIEGLSLKYTGSGSGPVGSLTASRGIASIVELAAKGLVEDGSGSIDTLVEQGQVQIDRMERRIDAIEDRLARRRELLLRRFVSAESALARSQQATDSLLNSLPQFGGSNR